MDVPADHQKIARMHFRLDPDHLTHKKVVYQVMDLLGDIGGISEILMQLASLFLGGYLTFHSSIETMKVLYNSSSLLNTENE